MGKRSHSSGSHSRSSGTRSSSSHNSGSHSRSSTQTSKPVDKSGTIKKDTNVWFTAWFLPTMIPLLFMRNKHSTTPTSTPPSSTPPTNACKIQLENLNTCLKNGNDCNDLRKLLDECLKKA